uniref:Uncharacterized protein n=1 Tax=Setaria italica TaxID=4555 RepID=K3YXJ9_SETIT
MSVLNSTKYHEGPTKVGTVQMFKESIASLLEMKHHNIENPTKSKMIFSDCLPKKSFTTK